VDALGIAGVAVGGILLWSAVKGVHPWTEFLTLLGKTPGAPNAFGVSQQVALANAPSTGPAPTGVGGSLHG
jgi:hypothetical protein